MPAAKGRSFLGAAIAALLLAGVSLPAAASIPPPVPRLEVLDVAGVARPLEPSIAELFGVDGALDLEPAEVLVAPGRPLLEGVRLVLVGGDEPRLRLIPQHLTVPPGSVLAAFETRLWAIDSFDQEQHQANQCLAPKRRQATSNTSTRIRTPASTWTLTVNGRRGARWVRLGRASP